MLVYCCTNAREDRFCGSQHSIISVVSTPHAAEKQLRTRIAVVSKNMAWHEVQRLQRWSYKTVRRQGKSLCGILEREQRLQHPNGGLRGGSTLVF